jgi:hypothetical protein
MDHLFPDLRMLVSDQVTVGRVRRLLAYERRYGSVAVAAMEVSHKLRDVFVNRTSRFKRRVIVSSLANEVLVSFTTAAAVDHFSDFMFGRSIDKHGRRWFLYLSRQRVVVR